MCVVSMISDGYRPLVPGWEEYKFWPAPEQPTRFPPFNVSAEEFNKLKKEVEALKELLKAAKKFDEKTGQKDCEKDEKVAALKQLAEYLGVDLEDVFK